MNPFITETIEAAEQRIDDPRLERRIGRQLIAKTRRKQGFGPRFCHREVEFRTGVVRKEGGSPTGPPQK